MNMIYTNSCKYQLPCGWCELRKMMCPNNLPCLNNPSYPITLTWQNTTDSTVTRAEESDGRAKTD